MINEEHTKQYKPAQAIIVYKKDHEYYLETHNLTQSGSKTNWGEGKPFQKEDLKDLSLSLTKTVFEPMKVRGLLPENVMYFNQSLLNVKIIWHTPAMSRTLHFNKKLKIASGTMFVPPMIWSVDDGELDIFVYKGPKKPGIKTPLFKAPFHNIHEGGNVCTGNIRESKQKEFLEDEILRHEGRFFNSNFTHFLDEKVVAKTTNLALLFKSLIGTKKPFPESVLVPSPSRVKNLELIIKAMKK